jgi:hypothetical protein
MPLIREQFQKLVHGSLAEDEDWLFVVADTDTGDIWVEHKWHHMNPYKSKVTSEGTEKFPLEEYSKHGQQFDEALGKVRNLLAQS